MPLFDTLVLGLSLAIGYGFIRWCEMGLELWFKDIRDSDRRN